MFVLTMLQKSPDFPKGNSEVIDNDISCTINFVVTRFFLKEFRFNRYKENFDEYEYLRNRCQLFLKFCYPSVISQLRENDRWYLLVSPEYIDFVKSQLVNIDSKVLVGNFSKAQIYEKLNNVIDSDMLPCVTRIDNDDTLGADYLMLLNKVVCSISKKLDYGFVIFPYGVQYDIRSNEIGIMMYNDTHTFSVFYKHLIQDGSVPWLFDYSHASMFENSLNFVMCNTTLPMWSENLSGTNQANSKRGSCLRLINEQFLLGKLFPNFDLL